MTHLSRYFIAFEVHSSFVKDSVGGDTKSDAEEQDVDDGTDDMQGDLSIGNSCKELQQIILYSTKAILTAKV